MTQSYEILFDSSRCVVFLIYHLHNFYKYITEVINRQNYALASVKMPILQLEKNGGSIYIYGQSLTSEHKKICCDGKRTEEVYVIDVFVVISTNAIFG